MPRAAAETWITHLSGPTSSGFVRFPIWIALTAVLFVVACGSNGPVDNPETSITDIVDATARDANIDEVPAEAGFPEGIGDTVTEVKGSADAFETDAGTTQCYPDNDDDNVPVMGESITIEGIDTPCPDGYAILLPFGAGMLVDCDDGDPDVHPGAVEVCNGKDDDCSGGTDNGLVKTCVTNCDTQGQTECVGGEWTPCAQPGTECCPGELKDVIPCPPFDFVFLTDNSGSMSSSDPIDIRFAAIGAFIDNMDNDLGLIVGFESYVEVYGYFTNDKEELHLFLEQAANSGSGGGTDIDGALYEVFDLFLDSGRKKVVLMLTDGQDNGGYDPEDLRVAAEAKDIRVYILGLGDDVDEDMLTQTVTGDGEYYFAQHASDIFQVYDDIFTLTNYESWKECSDEGFWVKHLGACE